MPQSWLEEDFTITFEFVRPVYFCHT